MGEEAFALLPSAMLGPAAWESVGEELRGLGVDAVVVGDPAGKRESVASVLRWYLDSLPEGRDYVLVPHSNAGLFVPLLARRRSVAASVFVDAALPPRSGSVPVVPEGMRPMLTELAGADGRLPVWTSWWDPDEVDQVVPSGPVRARLEAEQVRLPLAYLLDEVSVPEGWSRAPSAYLAFGATYGDEIREAAGRGWPTGVLPGEHLHMLEDPAGVARTLVGLRARLSPKHADDPGSE